MGRTQMLSSAIGVFLLLISTNLDAAAYYKGGDQDRGPSWVIKTLEAGGVFQVPAYKVTSEYDQYREYPHLKGLFFEGLPYHGRNTKVFCWYGVPESLEPGEKAPAVVLVHGGGGTVFPDWVKKWTDHGYIAISVALEGQVPGPRIEDPDVVMKHPTTEDSGPYRRGFFLGIKDEKLQDQWFYHAVADIILANSLIRSFPEVDTAMIGITGISWGGILTNVVTGIDYRFGFSIPVYGCGYLHEAPTYKRQLESHTPESERFYLENWEPSLYIPLQDLPTLFVNGTNDGHFPMNSFTKTYHASASEKYLHVEHEMRHGHYPGWEPEVIYAFADYVTGRGKAPLVLNWKRGNRSVIVSSGDVSDAIAYFTTDTADWSGDSYRWIETDARISKSGRKIKAEIPEAAVYYFVNCENDDGLIYSTPMVRPGFQ